MSVSLRNIARAEKILQNQQPINLAVQPAVFAPAKKFFAIKINPLVSDLLIEWE